MAVRVPYEPYPTAQPTAPGTPSVGVTTPGAAFGVNVGQAIGRLGEQLGAGGNELFRAALQVQNISNETEARNGGIAFTGAAGNLLTDFQTKEGMNSKSALPKFNKDLNDLWQKHRSLLSTDAARRQFDSEYGRELNYMLLGASRHAGIEIKKARDDANKAAIDSNISTTQLDPTNDQGFQQRLDHTIQLTRDYWAGKGALKERVDEEIRGNTEAMYRSKILGLMKQDPYAALRELEAARQRHVPGQLDIFGDQADYNKLETAVLNEMGKVDGRNLGHDAVKQGIEKGWSEDQTIDAVVEQAKKRSTSPAYLTTIEDETRARFRSVQTGINNQRTQQVRAGMDEAGKLEATLIKRDETGREIIDPSFFEKMQGVADKYKDYHEVVRYIDQVMKGAAQPPTLVTDKSVYNDLVARMADSNNPTSELQIAEANAARKLDPSSHAALKELYNIRNKAWLHAPDMQQKLFAIQGMIGKDAVTDWHDKYSTFLTKLLKEFPNIPENERIDALNTDDPKSWVSKVIGSKPGEGMRPTEAQMQEGSILHRRGLGGVGLTAPGVAVPGGGIPLMVPPEVKTPEQVKQWAKNNNLKSGTSIILPDGRPATVP